MPSLEDGVWRRHHPRGTPLGPWLGLDTLWGSSNHLPSTSPTWGGPDPPHPIFISVLYPLRSHRPRPVTPRRCPKGAGRDQPRSVRVDAGAEGLGDLKNESWLEERDTQDRLGRRGRRGTRRPEAADWCLSVLRTRFGDPPGPGWAQPQPRSVVRVESLYAAPSHWFFSHHPPRAQLDPNWDLARCSGHPYQ